MIDYGANTMDDSNDHLANDTMGFGIVDNIGNTFDQFKENLEEIERRMRKEKGALGEIYVHEFDGYDIEFSFKRRENAAEKKVRLVKEERAVVKHKLKEQKELAELVRLQEKYGVKNG